MLICTTGSHAGESQSRGKSNHKNAQQEGSDEIVDNIYSTYIQKTTPKYIDNNLNKKYVNKAIVERKTSKYEQKIRKYQPKEIPAKTERKITKYQPTKIPIKTTKIYDNKSYDFMTLFATKGHNEYSNALFENTGAKRNDKKSIFDERKKTRHVQGVNNKINNSPQNTVLSDTKKIGENAVSLNANQIRMQLIFAVLQKLETYLESGNLTDKFLRANQVTEKGQLVARPSYETQRLNSLQNPKDFGVGSMHRIKGTNVAQKDPVRKGINKRKKDGKKNRNAITGKTLLTNHTNLKVTEKNHVNKTIFNENIGKSKTKVPSVKLFNRQKAKKENALQNNLIGKQNGNIMEKKTYNTKKTASRLSGNVNTFAHRRNQNERTHTKKTASKLSGNVNTFDHRRNQNERTHTKKTASKLSGNVNTFAHRRNQNERTLNAVQNIPKTQHKTIHSNNNTRRSSRKYVNETLLMNERIKQGNAKDRQISTSERHGKIIDVIKTERATHKNVTPVEYNTISLRQDVRLHPKALQEISINRLENKLSEVVNSAPMSVNVAVVDNSQQNKSRIAAALSPQINGGEITNSPKTPSPALDTKGRQPKAVNKTNVGGTYVYEIIEIVHYGNNTKLNTSLPKDRKAFIGTHISLKTSPKNNKQGLSGTQGHTTKTFMNVEANSQNTASGNTNHAKTTAKDENMKYKSYTKQISEKRRRTHKSINKENVQNNLKNDTKASSLNVATKLTGNITVARTDISFLIGTKAATAKSPNQPLNNTISTHTSVGWYGIAAKNSIGHSNVARLDTKSNTARIHNTKHIYNTTKTKQPAVIKEISPISPTELTAFASSKRNQNITKNINNNRNNTAEPTAVGINIPPAQSTGVNIPPAQPLAQSTGVIIPLVQPLTQSTGVNISPAQPLAQSTGVNIPPAQPLAQSTRVNIPPVKPLAQSTGVNIPPVQPLAQSIGINIPPMQPLAQSTGINIPPVKPLAQSTGVNIPPVQQLAQSSGVNIPPVHPLAQPPVDVGLGLTNLSKGKFHLVRKYLLQMIHQLNEHITAKYNPNQMLFQTGKKKGGNKSYQNHVINGASIHATKGKLHDKTSKTKQHKIKTYVSSPVQNGFQIVDLNSNQYANTNSAPTSVPHKDIHQNFNSAQLGNVRSTALKSVTNENKYLELNKQNAMSTPYRNSNLAFNTVPRRDYSRTLQSINRTPNHKPQSKITSPNVDLISHSNNIDIQFLNPGVTLHRLKIPQINAVSRVEKKFHPIVPDIKSNLIRNNNNIPAPNNVAPIKQVSGPETGFTNRQSSINNYKSTLTKNLEALLKFSDLQLAERGKMHKYLPVPVNEKRKLNTYNSAGNLMSNHINNIQDKILNGKTNTMIPTGTGNVIASIDSSKSVHFAGPLSQVQSNSHKGNARLAANSAKNRLLEKSLLGNSIMADHTRSGLNTGIFDLVKGKSTTGNLKSNHRNAIKAIPELNKSILGNNLMHDHVNSDFKTNYVWDHIKGHSLTNKKYNVIDGPGVPQISTTRLHNNFDITNAILGNAVRNLNSWNLNQGLHNSKTETMLTSPPLNRKMEILSKNTLSSDLVHNNPAMDVSSLFKDIAASVLYERLKGSTATGSNTGSGIGSQNMFNPIHTDYLNPGVHTPQQNNNNIHSKKLSTTVIRKRPSQDIHPNKFQSEFVASYQRQRSIDNWMPTNPW